VEIIAGITIIVLAIVIAVLLVVYSNRIEALQRRNTKEWTAKFSQVEELEANAKAHIKKEAEKLIAVDLKRLKEMQKSLEQAHKLVGQTVSDTVDSRLKAFDGKARQAHLSLRAYKEEYNFTANPEVILSIIEDFLKSHDGEIRKIRVGLHNGESGEKRNWTNGTMSGNLDVACKQLKSFASLEILKKNNLRHADVTVFFNGTHKKDYVLKICPTCGES
jgi:hypothetical protein